MRDETESRGLVQTMARTCTSPRLESLAVDAEEKSGAG